MTPSPFKDPARRRVPPQLTDPEEERERRRRWLEREFAWRYYR